MAADSQADAELRRRFEAWWRSDKHERGDVRSVAAGAYRAGVESRNKEITHRHDGQKLDGYHPPRIAMCGAALEVDLEKLRAGAESRELKYCKRAEDESRRGPQDCETCKANEAANMRCAECGRKIISVGGAAGSAAPATPECPTCHQSVTGEHECYDSVLNEAPATKPLDARAIDLARRFHTLYEALAPQFGYETRKESAKPWSQVPEQNQNLMIAVCEQILKDYPFGARVAAEAEQR